MDNIIDEYDLDFSNVCSFPTNIDELLNHKFWQIAP